MKQKPRRIDEELVCIDALKYTLEVQFGCKVGTPERTRPGFDPPDFWLQIDGTRTPVEITSITERQSYRSHCRQMADSIQEDARTSKILFGTYVLIIRGYPRIPNTSKKRSSSTYSDAKKYVFETANISTADEIVLLDDDRGTIAFKKVSDREAQIVELHTVCEREGETDGKLADLIDSACQSKSTKLLKNDCMPRETIIVLYDAYGFADVEQTQAATARVDAVREFHSVFWVASFTNRKNETFPNEPGRHGFFLWSTIPQWIAAQHT